MGFLRRSVLSTLVLLAGLVPLVPPARAQQPVAVSAERLEKARKHMEDGQNFYAQKKYAEAAQAFQLAYTAQPFAAFLFNEAVCYEKLNDVDKALATFRRYLAADPNPPDADALKARIKRLEDQKGGGASAPAPDARPEAMRSLLVFESNPAGAPAQIWQKVEADAPAFSPGGDNKGWKIAASGPTPLVATLAPGRYHAAVERWRSYNRSDDDVEVATGRVVQYRSNLSQGDFMGFLRVTVDDIDDAQIFLDDPPPHRKKPWGTAPHGELIPKGEHKIWVEAPGYEVYTETFTVDTGQQKNIQPALERVGYGYLLIDGNANRIRLQIDGEEVGIYQPDDGPFKIKVPKGTHRLQGFAEGKKPFSSEVEVPAGQVRDVHLVLSTRYSRGAAWGASVLSAATLGAGIYLGVRSNGILDKVKSDRQRGDLAPDDKRVKEGRTYAILADVGFTSSFLLASFATFEFLRDPTPPSTFGFSEPRDFDAPREPAKRPGSQGPSLRFVPALTASQGAFFLQGAF